MTQLFANNANSTLASGITSGATSISLATGDGAKFPSPSGGDFFDITLTQPGAESSWEIARCTARSGDTLTVARGQEGSTAAAWSAGDKVELRITADAMSRALEWTDFKNKIIGGNFTTNPWGRGTSFAAVADSTYTADRFLWRASNAGAVTITKTADAPTLSLAGVHSPYCFHVDVTTADTSVASTDYANIIHRIEGQNIASMGFGQSGTRYATLSFMVKATKTGTYCVSFLNEAVNRRYIKEYTVSASDTWEKKTITIPVDTTGTWESNNGSGVEIRWMLMAGTDFNAGTDSAWQTTMLATTNQVNALDSTANNFKLALIQFEAGSVATPFETRSIGQELFLCQRYYEKSYMGGTAPGTAEEAGYRTFINSSSTNSTIGDFNFKVPKRTSSVVVTIYSPVTGTAARVRNENAGSDEVATVSSANANGLGRVYGTTTTSAVPFRFHFVANAEL